MEREGRYRFRFEAFPGEMPDDTAEVHATLELDQGAGLKESDELLLTLVKSDPRWKVTISLVPAEVSRARLEFTTTKSGALTLPIAKFRFTNDRRPQKLSAKERRQFLAKVSQLDFEILRREQPDSLRLEAARGEFAVTSLKARGP